MHSTVVFFTAWLAVLAASPGLGAAQAVRDTLPMPDPPFQGRSA